MHIERLVDMANDIAAFHGAADPQEAARNVALHLRRYWDPRMRKQIIEHYKAGGSAGLSELAREAVAMLAIDPTPSKQSVDESSNAGTLAGE